ncbi:thioredoxin family protein [Marinifilum caeruleilacunae]|jgi:thiol-disulfide isomerase/thioredoxin|uniref:Thioredoxin n=1 Tax=Marinifilum caeruleilacunae TaxID=2499076 RepID=A0ABX1WVW6_9BACT|nr:thioredoxin family protein [Marinifilum caeruleilacunae]NOU60265.1 thioredoxin [Marinifilum caeruleilacunae]
MKIENLNELLRLKQENESFYIYFSAPGCGVCEVLRPKLGEMFQNKFPKLKGFHIDTALQPEIAAQEGLFTNPSLLVFIDGQEVLRRSRAIGLDEVYDALNRYYEMYF